MAQMQNVHNPHERFSKEGIGYSGYADFRWFLYFSVLLDPVITNYFEVKATILIEGTSDYVLDSLPVHTTYGKITLTFPPLLRESSIPTDESYIGEPTNIVNHIDQLSNSINITLNPPLLPGARPDIRLNACTISQDWIIGARNILLVEPPSTEMETRSGETASAG